MKLLYAFIILELIQLLALNSIAISTSSNTTTATTFKEKILQFYTPEYLALIIDVCENVKSMCKEILKDKKVQLASTPVMREFKHNITDFLYFYPAYKRYGMITDLLNLFETKIPDPSNNIDIQYIWDLLRQQGITDIYNGYEINYHEFIKSKFLPKLQELKSQLSKNELKQEQVLIKGFNKLKKCRNSECQFQYINEMVNEDYTAKRKLLAEIIEQVNNFNIFYGSKANDMANAVLKDQRLSRLSNAVRAHLKADIIDFIMKFESHQGIDELYTLNHKFYQKIIAKYYQNADFGLRDRQLIGKIFDGHGYSKFIDEYQRKYSDFWQEDLVKKFQEFKATLIREALAKEKPLLQWFNNFKRLTNFSDKITAMEKLDELI